MNTVVANRSDFFPTSGCPIALRMIQGETAARHAGDLTDVRHTHDFSELIIISGGGGRHWIDGETYPVSAGDIFLIQGNSEHYFLERHKLEMFNIMFDDSYIKEHLESLRHLAGFNAFFFFEPTYRKRHRFGSHLHVPTDAMRPLMSILQAMADELRRERPGSDLMMLAKALEIFVFISREYARDGNPMARSLCRLGEVISALENHYRSEWTIAKISRIAAMAPSTLLPVFKRVTGYSPIEYLLQLRLAKAAERLLKTDDQISEIALDCGFRDSNYFSRQFRKRYGVSPRAFRNG